MNSPSDRQRIWVVTELYYPEETSTGYLLTKIAEGLAGRQPVQVLCGQPTYSARGTRAPASEERNGVSIRRCWGTTFNKDNLLLRLINLLTLSLSIFLHALFRFRRGDRVLVVTNPPFLPFLIAFACFLRGAKCVLLIHDVYPEVLHIAGVMRPGTFSTGVLNWLNRRLYRGMERVVVLGHDMAKLAVNKLGGRSERVVIIPNWADSDEIHPSPKETNRLLNELGLQHKFVIQYAGNMGRTHGLESLVDAAIRMREHVDVHFLFIGSGAKKAWLETAVREHGLSNVTILGNQPRSEQVTFLNACDLAIISFMPGMAGISVPSRMYNVLASGTPILAVTDGDSELARVVLEEDVGWVLPPAQPQDVVAAILEAKSHPERLAEMSLRASQAARTTYSFPTVLAAYQALFDSLERPLRKPATQAPERPAEVTA